MATRLNANAIRAIIDDPKLFADVAKLLRLKPSSLNNTLRRNGRRLTEYDTLNSIAAVMGKRVEDIIEPTPKIPA